MSWLLNPFIRVFVEVDIFILAALVQTITILSDRKSDSKRKFVGFVNTETPTTNTEMDRT